MEEMISLLIIIIALIIFFLFAIPVILFGVSINVLTIYLCEGISPFYMWLLSLASSMFIAGIYSSILHITHFKVSKVIRDFWWIGLFSTFCVGLLTIYFIPTYKSLKTGKEVLYVSTNIFDELSKTYYINDTGKDFILYPITCSYYAEKYNIECKSIAFCRNMKIEDVVINLDQTLPDPDEDISNNKLVFYLLSPNTYSKVLAEEEQLKRNRIYPCKHVHRHKHRISHSDVYNWD